MVVPKSTQGIQEEELLEHFRDSLTLLPSAVADLQPKVLCSNLVVRFMMQASLVSSHDAFVCEYGLTESRCLGHRAHQ